MARKVDARDQPTAPQGAAGNDDLDILHPERTLTVAGRTVSVREYGFFEGMDMRIVAKDFFDALYALFGAAGPAPAYDEVEEVIAAHRPAVIGMVAAAIGPNPDAVADKQAAAQAHADTVRWVAGLDDAAGDALLVTWWMVNAGFFLRRMMRRAAQAALSPRARSAGAGSSTDSSPVATSAPSPSSHA